MTSKFTYSGNPASSSRDAVRFALGDTNSNEPIFTDSEIDWLLVEQGSINEAALAGAQAAVAKYARHVTSAPQDERKDLATRLEHFESLVKQLSAKRSKRVTGIYAGGISLCDKARRDADTDRNKGKFSDTMHENPNATISPLTGEDV